MLVRRSAVAAFAVAALVVSAGRASADGPPPTPDGGAPPSVRTDTPPPASASATTPISNLADGGSTPTEGLSPADEKALKDALQSDQAAQSQKNGAGPASAGTAPAAPGAPAAPSGIGATLGRFWQSLTPDISAIIDFAGGFYDGMGITKSGDDPGDTGANVQEVELAFSATVDPYFRADVFLTVPNLRGIEVEEAVLTTTSLPGSLQIRAGIMRAPFGRQNTQHLHLQDFTRRPQMNALFLGTDGLRAPGAEVSWLVPTPFYLLLTAAAYSVAPADEVGRLTSFGGGKRTDFTYLGNLRTFIPMGDDHSLLLGASFATGMTSQLSDATLQTFADPHRSYLYGADAYYKWKPANVASTWLMLGWTTEYYLRQVPDLSILDGALYSQLALRVARRWIVGVRGEVDGIPTSSAVYRQYAGGASLTWALSEFSRARIYGEGRYTPDFASSGGPWSTAVFLQLEASIGAHGAHPY